MQPIELLRVIDFLLSGLLTAFAFVIKPPKSIIILNGFVLSCTMIATAILTGGFVDWLLAGGIALLTGAGILLFTKD
jgi:hypothetical protein